MKHKTLYKTVLFISFVLIAVPNLFAESVNVTKFGAKGDGKTLYTKAIQKAIDHCSNTGGGEVIFPNGTFVTGTLVLKDNVSLHLQQNAVVKGSGNMEDYPFFHKEFRALVYSGNAKNVSIAGHGTIDGNGKAFIQKDNVQGRPVLVLFDHCENVRVQDVFLRNSAMWTLRLHKCDGVMLTRVDIYSHDNYNNDGIDIESRNVMISDCRIDTDDDAIVFKSDDPACVESEDPACAVENVTVTNCVISANCNFIKFGTGSYGIFRNISISNCSLHKASESKFRFWEETVWGVTEVTGISGIALEVVDGGVMDQVVISNITMTDVQTPIFIRLGKRNRDERKGRLENIVISNITATSQSYISSSITGIPGVNVENVIIKDCFLNVKGGGTEEDAKKEVPEVENNYPENRMFGQMLPAYGFFIRHADNITIDNIHLSYHSGAEERHAIVAENVSLLRITNSTWQKPVGELESLCIKNCPQFINRDNIEIEHK
jgi:polygalacturonase